ncbi:MAG: hypothetical protein K0U38_02615 [Epsilonproteobacteria bacterium]|nr:hypothetical protein [Campylobacterota bacterium]
MKQLKLIILVALVFFLGGCGTNTEDTNSVHDSSTVYDLWEYMTPSNSYEIEYDIYENGNRVDYFFETSRIIESGVVERESSGEVTTLVLNENSIKVEESDGEIVQVQRYVKSGDINVFQAPSIQSCSVETFYRTITIQTVEFYNVIQINCQTKSSSSALYYGYDEGIVSIYRDEGDKKIEIVKVGEQRL